MVVNLNGGRGEGEGTVDLLGNVLVLAPTLRQGHFYVVCQASWPTNFRGFLALIPSSCGSAGITCRAFMQGSSDLNFGPHNSTVRVFGVS